MCVFRICIFLSGTPCSTKCDDVDNGEEKICLTDGKLSLADGLQAYRWWAMGKQVTIGKLWGDKVPSHYSLDEEINATHKGKFLICPI